MLPLFSFRKGSGFCGNCQKRVFLLYGKHMKPIAFICGSFARSALPYCPFGGAALREADNPELVELLSCGGRLPIAGRRLLYLSMNTRNHHEVDTD
jgi:hypothetical protein